jgi:putative hydrolase of the HAD superfamily
MDFYLAHRFLEASNGATFRMNNQDAIFASSHNPVMTKAIDAMLFDRDGVLTYFDVNSAISFFRPLLPISLLEIAARWQALGVAVGFPRNLGEERLFWVNFWEQLSDEFLLTAEQRATLRSLDYTRFVVPYPEVRSVLEQLRAIDVRLGVLSNFSLASLEQSLVTSKLAEYFDIACSAAVIGAAKPAAKAYEIALKALQVKPEQCLFLDDEVECVEGARKLGVRAYLVDRQATTHNLERAVLANLQPVPLLVT